MIVVLKPKFGHKGCPTIIDLTVNSITPESQAEEVMKQLRDLPKTINRNPLVGWTVRIIE